MAEKSPYIATEPLFVGGVRAHNPGDVVPDDNVARHGWSDSVARQGTKAADKVSGVPDDNEPQPVSAQAPPPK